MTYTSYDELLASGPELIVLDAQAVRTSIEIVEQLTPADLDRPTPCEGWTLRDLLEHNIAQHYGFAAASRGEGDIAVWKTKPLGADPIAEYRAAAAHVLTAFAETGVLERRFPVPEIMPDLVIPANLGISFHFVDYVVHSWDMAASLGVKLDFDEELLSAALLIARAVPGGDVRTRPGASFAPIIELTGGSTLDQILALLGRSPDWKA